MKRTNEAFDLFKKEYRLIKLGKNITYLNY